MTGDLKPMTFLSVNGLLTFIKDWIPSIAAIIAGIWILFQWLFGEWLRRKKEIPALDGRLSATIIPSENGKLLVTVEGLWNNHSPLPVYLSIEKCRIVIYHIDPHLKQGNCALTLTKDLGEPVCNLFFLVGMCEVDYFLEPNTASTIINHFILEPGIYGVRMELHSLVVGVNWWKELIVDAQHHKAKSHPAN